MRFKPLLTSCIVSISLLTYANPGIAAAKTNKNSTTSNHLSNKKGKAKKALPMDLWERIRLGMSLPKPAPIELPGPLPLLSSTSTTTQPTALTPPFPVKTKALNLPLTNKATARPAEFLKTSTGSTSSDKTKALKTAPTAKTTPSLNVAQNTITDSDTAQKRIHTRIDFKAGMQTPSATLSSDELDADTLIPTMEPPMDMAEATPKADASAKSTSNAYSAIADTIETLVPKPLSLEEIEQQQKAQQRLLQQAANYERVNRFVQRYAQQKGYLIQLTERAQPYLYHIVETLRNYKIPTELALLPIVESGYQPTALSPKSAAGLWQFIPQTGLEYDLKQTELYDYRLDITASTKAAMRFLSFLQQRYHGDWLLAIAAYNCGPGRVDEAIRQNKANGLDTDYWSLQLPEETQDYVPRLLALSTIFGNPEAYGLKLKRLNNEPYFVTVKLNRDMDKKHLDNKDIKEVAALADLSLEHFKLLNPGYLMDKFSAENNFNLLLPIANANLLYDRLDTLAEIENNPDNQTPLFSVKPDSYTNNNWNKPSLPYLALNLDSDSGAFASSDPAAPKLSIKEVVTLKTHYLDSGETLASLAKQFHLSPEELRAANKLPKRSNLSLGQQLVIPIKRKVIIDQRSNFVG